MSVDKSNTNYSTLKVGICEDQETIQIVKKGHDHVNRKPIGRNYF